MSKHLLVKSLEGVVKCLKDVAIAPYGLASETIVRYWEALSICSTSESDVIYFTSCIKRNTLMSKGFCANRALNTSGTDYNFCCVRNDGRSHWCIYKPFIEIDK